MQWLPVLHHEIRRRIVVLADVFEQLHVGRPAQIKAAAPRFCVYGRIINEHFVLDGIEICPCEAFEGMELDRKSVV